MRNADQRVPDALLERAALHEGERRILQFLAGEVAIQRQSSLLQYRMLRIDGDAIQFVHREVFLRLEPGAGQGICCGTQVERSQRRRVDAACLQQAVIGNGRHGGSRWKTVVDGAVRAGIGPVYSPYNGPIQQYQSASGLSPHASCCFDFQGL